MINDKKFIFKRRFLLRHHKTIQFITDVIDANAFYDSECFVNIIHKCFRDWPNQQFKPLFEWIMDDTNRDSMILPMTQQFCDNIIYCESHNLNKFNNHSFLIDFENIIVILEYAITKRWWETYIRLYDIHDLTEFVFKCMSCPRRHRHPDLTKVHFLYQCVFQKHNDESYNEYGRKLKYAMKLLYSWMKLQNKINPNEPSYVENSVKDVKKHEINKRCLDPARKLVWKLVFACIENS